MYCLGVVVDFVIMWIDCCGSGVWGVVVCGYIFVRREFMCKVIIIIIVIGVGFGGFVQVCQVSMVSSVQYCWCDVQGLVYYSDSLLFDVIVNGYDVVNSQGLVMCYVVCLFLLVECVVVKKLVDEVVVCKCEDEQCQCEDQQMLVVYLDEVSFVVVQKDEFSSIDQQIIIICVSLGMQEKVLIDLFDCVGELECVK